MVVVDVVVVVCGGWGRPVVSFSYGKLTRWSTAAVSLQGCQRKIGREGMEGGIK